MFLALKIEMFLLKVHITCSIMLMTQDILKLLSKIVRFILIENMLAEHKSHCDTKDYASKLVTNSI